MRSEIVVGALLSYSSLVHTVNVGVGVGEFVGAEDGDNDGEKDGV